MQKDSGRKEMIRNILNFNIKKQFLKLNVKVNKVLLERKVRKRKSSHRKYFMETKYYGNLKIYTEGGV